MYFFSKIRNGGLFYQVYYKPKFVKNKTKAIFANKKRQHVSSNHEPHRTFCPVKRQVHFDRLSFLRYNHVFRFLKRTRVRERFLFSNWSQAGKRKSTPGTRGITRVISEKMICLLFLHP